MAAAGITPTVAKGKKKKKAKKADEKAASAASDQPEALEEKPAAARPAVKLWPYDPPKFAQLKIPKGTGVEVDVARIEALLSGWGDPAAINEPDPETGETALHLAAAAGRTQVVTVLLLKGAAVGAVDRAGRTPLYHAACNGQLDTVMQLLEKGADKGAVNKLGNTPLHAACRNGHREVIELLMSIGCDPHAENNEKKDAFARAKDPVLVEFMKAVAAGV
jgi:hypothetical protein